MLKHDVMSVSAVWIITNFFYLIMESELDLDLAKGESCFVASAFRAQMMSSMCWATSSIATKDGKKQKVEKIQV